MKIIAVDKYHWAFIQKNDGSVVLVRWGCLGEKPSSLEEAKRCCATEEFIESNKEFEDDVSLALFEEINRLFFQDVSIRAATMEDCEQMGANDSLCFLPDGKLAIRSVKSP